MRKLGRNFIIALAVTVFLFPVTGVVRTLATYALTGSGYLPDGGDSAWVAAINWGHLAVNVGAWVITIVLGVAWVYRAIRPQVAMDEAVWWFAVTLAVALVAAMGMTAVSEFSNLLVSVSFTDWIRLAAPIQGVHLGFMFTYFLAVFFAIIFGIAGLVRHYQHRKEARAAAESTLAEGESA